MSKAMSKCQKCEGEFPRADLYWVNDNYGIPFKLVCNGCYDETESEIRGWKFDPADAGERLGDDDDLEGWY